MYHPPSYDDQSTKRPMTGTGGQPGVYYYPPGSMPGVSPGSARKSVPNFSSTAPMSRPTTGEGVPVGFVAPPATQTSHRHHRNRTSATQEFPQMPDARPMTGTTVEQQEAEGDGHKHHRKRRKKHGVAEQSTIDDQIDAFIPAFQVVEEQVPEQPYNSATSHGRRPSTSHHAKEHKPSPPPTNNDEPEPADRSCFTNIMLFFARIVAIIAVLGVLLIFVLFIFSYYGIIIMNFTFFVSSLVSYALQPMYHAFANDWWLMGASFCQAIVNAPYIEFYILYVIISVKQIVGMIPDIVGITVATWKGIIRVIQHQVLTTDEHWTCKLGCAGICVIFLGIFLAIAMLAIGIAAFVGSIISTVFALVPGILIYIPVVVQTFGAVLPVYGYWLRTLVCGWSPRFRCMKKMEDYFERQEAERDNDGKGNAGANKIIAGEEANPNDIEDDGGFSVTKFLKGILWPGGYYEIFRFGTRIAEDKRHRFRKALFLLIFTGLNGALVVFDIGRLRSTWNVYFLVSIIMRIAFLPLASFFHVLVPFFHKIKDRTLRWIVKGGTWLTVLIIALSIGSVAYTRLLINVNRIDSLMGVGEGVNTSWYHKDLYPPVCSRIYEDMNLVELTSLAIGGYDVTTNEEVFDLEMTHFFGDEWNTTIIPEVILLKNDIPMVAYDFTEKNLTVYALRGFASGPELAFQMQMLASHYVVPFFESMIILYNIMSLWFLKEYVPYAHTLGTHFFDPKAVSIELVQNVIDTVNARGTRDYWKTMFVGINTGGVMAKVAGMKTNNTGIGLASFPAFTSTLSVPLSFLPAMSYNVVNIWQLTSLFSGQEPNSATNIVMPTTSRIIFDSSYEPFCMMSQLCHQHVKYESFCRSAVGNQTMDEIFTWLQENFPYG